jgi:CheY-like chemotaxis protein
MPVTLPKKILIVDDEEEALRHLKNILGRANYDVACVTNGKDAISCAKNLKPDLIILDIVMPDIDGADVAAILSQDPLTSEIPILFLTGILTKEEQLLDKKTGKHRVIAKPIAAKELLELIGKTLSEQS